MAKSSRLAKMRATEINDDDAMLDEAAETTEVINLTDLSVRTGLTSASVYQTAIFEHVATQIAAIENNEPATALAVQAVAGSGKTTTIVAAAKLIPRNLKSVFLAFNRSIAEELDERLPNHVNAKTLNSMGFAMLRPYLRSIGVSNPNVTGYRTQKIMRAVMSFKQQDDYGTDVKWLVTMAKATGLIPVGVNDGKGAEATDAALLEMAIHHGKNIDIVSRPVVFRLAREILLRSWSESDLYDNKTIDYDDQKWLTVCKRPGGRPLFQPEYDVVIVDEVQDVNSVDVELLRMLVKPGGLVIGVGDTKQAIYGFRGADTKAFENFANTFNATRLPLTITYRCGTALVAHAQKLVPEIEAAPNAATGSVEYFTKYDSSLLQPGDLVMCRNNAPLIEIAYWLIRSRVPVYVKGKDFSGDLIQIITNLVAKKTFHGKGKPPTWEVDGINTTTLIGKLNGWLETQIDIIRADDPDNEVAVQRVTDMAASIRVFISMNTDGKVSTVISEIENLFADTDPSGKVVCSTIHKAKGLEADRAFIYRNELFYPPYLVTDWQIQQEKHLDYVARTRGKVLYGHLSERGWA